MVMFVIIRKIAPEKQARGKHGVCRWVQVPCLSNKSSTLAYGDLHMQQAVLCLYFMKIPHAAARCAVAFSMVHIHK